jgi:hypothetical protein
VGDEHHRHLAVALLVGSSANSSLGPHANATAITTRWRMPPDSSWGYWRSRRAGSGMLTDLSSASAVSCASERSMSKWKSSDSVICLPMRITGLSDVMGSWNTMASWVPQNERNSAGPIWSSRWPSKLIVPLRVTLRLGSSPMIERDSTDLPQPDSPTSPSVRPRSSVNDTPSTALTVPRGVLK